MKIGLAHAELLLEFNDLRSKMSQKLREKFIQVVEFAHDRSKKWLKLIEFSLGLFSVALSEKSLALFQSRIHSQLLVVVWKELVDSALQYYSWSLRQINANSNSNSNLCNFCRFKYLGDFLGTDMSMQDEFAPFSQQIDTRQNLVREVGYKINQLGWTRYLEGHIERAFKNFVLEYSEMVKMNFSEPVIPSIASWFQSRGISWILLNFFPDYSSESTSSFQEKCFAFEFCLLKTFYCERSSEIFDIIVDYPDSSPAIKELGYCIKTTNDNKMIVQAAISAFNQRLLHYGVKTSIIIEQYVSTIRSLLLLDPSGNVLSAVSTPIAKYLRSRDDTAKELVLKLFNDPNEDLADELRRETPIIMQDDESDSELLDENWIPPPRDIDSIVLKHNGDILNSLINIFPSKEVFLNQFENYLSNCLLSNPNYDVDAQIGNVEILKLRFGESSMQNCEVMLKDVGESRRTDATVHEYNDETLTNIHPLIISHLFWPKQKENSLRIPEGILHILESYNERYKGIKRSRFLDWKTEYGVLELEIEMEDQTRVAFSTNLFQASMIWLFQDNNTLSVDDLVESLDTSEDSVRSGLSFWVSKGILKQTSSASFTLSQSARKEPLHDIDNAMEEDEEESGSSMNDMKIYWTYISAMLTNLGALPAARIHNMLNMFVQAPNKYDRTENELKEYLDSMVSRDHLEFLSGSYKLK